MIVINLIGTVLMGSFHGCFNGDINLMGCKTCNFNEQPLVTNFHFTIFMFPQFNLIAPLCSKNLTGPLCIQGIWPRSLNVLNYLKKSLYEGHLESS